VKRGAGIVLRGPQVGEGRPHRKENQTPSKCGRLRGRTEMKLHRRQTHTRAVLS
jgi:hypothetical protein